MEEEKNNKRIAIFEGEAKIGKVLEGLHTIQLKPEDFSSPIALQMALSRIYSAVIKMFEKGPKEKYIAEIRFRDAMGNLVTLAVDMGEAPPPFSKEQVKARILIEIYEE